MAVVKPGAGLSVIKGKISGSVFHNNTGGQIMYSNNWSKRGHTWRSYQERAAMGTMASQWRALDPQDRLTFLDSAHNKAVFTTNGDEGKYKVSSNGNSFNIMMSYQSVLQSIKLAGPKKVKPGLSGPNPFLFLDLFVGGSPFRVYINMGPSAWTQAIVAVWAGPFTPIWKKISTKRFLRIIQFEIYGTDLPIDLTAFYEINYPFVTNDPGYIYAGAQLFSIQDTTTAGYTWFYNTKRQFHVWPINGAPPYK